MKEFIVVLKNLFGPDVVTERVQADDSSSASTIAELRHFNYLVVETYAID